MDLNVELRRPVSEGCSAAICGEDDETDGEDENEPKDNLVFSSPHNRTRIAFGAPRGFRRTPALTLWTELAAGMPILFFRLVIVDIVIIGRHRAPPVDCGSPREPNPA